MKIELKLTKEFEVKTLHVRAGVRYWEDATLNGVQDAEGNIPCRKGKYWEPIINVDSGIILNWAKGNKAYVHYKVCDDGVYILKDIDGNEITKTEGYVPDFMCPEEDSYGDYIIMKIDENGQIANWDFKWEEEE